MFENKTLSLWAGTCIHSQTLSHHTHTRTHDSLMSRMDFSLNVCTHKGGIKYTYFR